MEDFDFYGLLYAEELDAWIVQTTDEPDEDGNISGIVIFVGENRSVKDQQDELLDLILEKDENEEYYKEILNYISQ